MNLLLLWRHELASDGTLHLDDDRARHLCRVLRVQPGQALVAGCVNESTGVAVVLSVARDAVRVRYEPRASCQAPCSRALLLAMPRPKVLSRCLEHAAALGYTKIALFRSYRVEKSHLTSHKLDPDDMQRHLVHGLEQARRVHLPELRVFERFKPFVEDELPTWVPKAQRYVAHPTASNPLSEQRLESAAYTLAIGPEGGFIPFEVAALEAQGFVPVSAGAAPLRVESALSYLTAQLDLLASLTPARKRPGEEQ